MRYIQELLVLLCCPSNTYIYIYLVSVVLLWPLMLFSNELLLAV